MKSYEAHNPHAPDRHLRRGISCRTYHCVDCWSPELHVLDCPDAGPVGGWIWGMDWQVLSGMEVENSMRKNLKEARQAAGMTQQQVADKLGISQRAYQNIEYGKILGKITHWDILEDLFKVPQRQLREMQ